MIPPGQLTGAVLAGGQSRRMGRDKATLALNGVPLWQRQVAALRSAASAIVGVVRRPDQPPLELPDDVPLWQDAVVDAGPLAGLQAALAACRSDWLAVVATDMPHIDAAWFLWLAEFCGIERGAVAQRTDGSFEPLAAIYPRIALAEATQRLESEDRSLQSFVRSLVARRRLAVVPLGASSAWQVENWNEPGDIKAAP